MVICAESKGYITVTLQKVNDLPISQSVGHLQVDEDDVNGVVILLPSNDAEGSQLTYSAIAGEALPRTPKRNCW